jgi:tetratricopeptide (TPR) repeat protein
MSLMMLPRPRTAKNIRRPVAFVLRVSLMCMIAASQLLANAEGRSSTNDSANLDKLAPGPAHSRSRQAEARLLFEQGMALRQKQDWNASYRALQQSLTLDPSNGDCLHRIIECEVSLSKLPEARRSLARLEKVDSNHAFLPYLKCLVPWCAVDMQEALRNLRYYDKLGKLDHHLDMYRLAMDRTMLVAWAELEAKRFQSARDLCTSLSDWRPECNLFPVICREFVLRKDKEGLHRFIGSASALAKDCKTSKLALELLPVLAASGELVVDCYLTVHRRFPQDKSVLSSPAFVSACMDEFRGSALTAATLHHILDQIPEGISKQRLAAFYCQTQKQPDRALEFYESALAKDPGNADLYVDRAILYMKVFNGDAALADLNTAIELSPQNSRYYTLRAQCYRNHLIEPKLAMADLKTAERLSKPALTPFKGGL